MIRLSFRISGTPSSLCFASSMVLDPNIFLLSSFSLSIFNTELAILGPGYPLYSLPETLSFQPTKIFPFAPFTFELTPLIDTQLKCPLNCRCSIFYLVCFRTWILFWWLGFPSIFFILVCPSIDIFSSWSSAWCSLESFSCSKATHTWCSTWLAPLVPTLRSAGRLPKMSSGLLPIDWTHTLRMSWKTGWISGFWSSWSFSFRFGGEFCVRQSWRWTKRSTASRITQSCSPICPWTSKARTSATKSRSGWMTKEIITRSTRCFPASLSRVSIDSKAN